MNNAGQMAVGSAGPGTASRSFLYTPGNSGGLVDLGPWGAIVATALNASGQVVGTIDTPPPASKPSSTKTAACSA